MKKVYQQNWFWQSVLCLAGGVLLGIVIWMGIGLVYWSIKLTTHTKFDVSYWQTANHPLEWGSGLLIGMIVSLLYFGFGGHIWKSKSKKNMYGKSRFLKENELNLISKKINDKNKLDGWTIKNELQKTKYQGWVVPKQHGLLVGATGSGKTQKIVIPSIINNLQSESRPSMVVTDLKGTIAKATEKIAKREKYNILTFDFINFQKNKWNPFLKVQELWNKKKYEEATELIEKITKVINDNVASKSEPFWHTSSLNLIHITVKTLLIQNTWLKKTKHVNNVLNFLMIAQKLNLSLKDYKIWISKWKNNEEIKHDCGDIFSSNEKTLQSIFMTARSAFNALKSKRFLQMTSGNDLNVKQLLATPTIVYLRTEIADTKYWFLNKLFLTLVINELFKNNGLNLKRAIYFVLDEFANIPKIDRFETVLSVAREFNMWFLMAVQDYAQIEQYQGWKSMIANCNLKYYLHTNNFETAEMISKEYGQQTMMAKNKSRNKFGKSESTHDVGRPLIDANSLMKLKQNEVIVQLSRFNPAKFKSKSFWDMKEAYQKRVR